MTEVTFGRLTDLLPREAWRHESLSFTPWLAANIDQLSDAVGMTLELTGTEMAVETFAADLLARNADDGTVVLVENQLERTDHTHLGQIMTYLAGLEAQTVVWIAPEFREPHLSAIRWLNQHTADGFSFFAVRLRVVRIGDSPYAPIFEVVEKPNDWEREVKQRVSQEGNAYYDIKQSFWHRLLQRYPELALAGVKDWRYANNYITLRDAPMVQLSIWFGKSKSGVYVRSGWNEPSGPVSELLLPHQDLVEARLSTRLGPSGRDDHFLPRTFSKGHEHEADWPAIMDWINSTVREYQAVLVPVLRGDTSDVER
ncbi:hypothetical protein [Aquibium sp. ELW1220]|uniref:hypothetical protein n=1 Tax=Aquibium sp. ELW1220 TaxID=2976766 RepID=UPI0025AF7057|nr:hypothetical protein [Aquibium sp. ELW1220]MDN2581395.1 hypothetical protein [Aquibium sp. ELW1220]